MSRTIALIGFMGCGKSYLGKDAARTLGMKFADTDSLIEETAKMSISRIFAEQGEEVFRRIETEVLRESCRDNHILATGGGIVKEAQNVDMLHAMGAAVVWLKISPERIFQRLQRDNSRPLLAGAQGEEKLTRIRNLLQERESLYQRAAQYIFIEDDFPESRVGEEFAAWLKREIFEKDGKNS